LDSLATQLSDAQLKLDERDNMIWGLRCKLEHERKSAQWTKSDKIKRVMERNELEDFFLECVEEVRKEI
jgi:hypothetical protein